ncbi:hypothetical protein H0H93_000856, partial [Arthromyces matolae]
PAAVPSVVMPNPEEDSRLNVPDGGLQASISNSYSAGSLTSELSSISESDFTGSLADEQDVTITATNVAQAHMEAPHKASVEDCRDDDSEDSGSDSSYDDCINIVSEACRSTNSNPLIMHNIKNTVSVAGIALDNEAGPSRDKGKGVDPRNWGDLEFSGEEFDPDIQQQILEECHRDNRKKVRHASSSGVAQPQVNIHSDSENSDRDFSPKHGSKKKNKKRAKRSKSSTKSKDSSNRELDDMIEQ